MEDRTRNHPRSVRRSDGHCADRISVINVPELHITFPFISGIERCTINTVAPIGYAAKNSDKNVSYGSYVFKGHIVV